MGLDENKKASRLCKCTLPKTFPLCVLSTLLYIKNKNMIMDQEMLCLNLLKL